MWDILSAPFRMSHISFLPFLIFFRIMTLSTPLRCSPLFCHSRKLPDSLEDNRLCPPSHLFFALLHAAKQPVFDHADGSRRAHRLSKIHTCPDRFRCKRTASHESISPGSALSMSISLSDSDSDTAAENAAETSSETSTETESETAMSP